MPYCLATALVIELNSMAERRFGQLIKAERMKRRVGDKPMKQSHLASLAQISSPFVSLIEVGHMFPSEDTANRLMDALALDGEARARLTKGYKDEQKVRESQIAEKRLKGASSEFVFSKPFIQIVSRLLSEEPKRKWTSRLAEESGIPASFMSMVVAGMRIPSAENIVDNLIPALEELGASEADIQKLLLAHLEDMLKRAIDLPYLDAESQQAIISAALQQARTELSGDRDS